MFPHSDLKPQNDSRTVQQAVHKNWLINDKYHEKLEKNAISVAMPSKAWVCGRLIARIGGSIPAGGTDVCLLRVLCVVR